MNRMLYVIAISGAVLVVTSCNHGNQEPITFTKADSSDQVQLSTRWKKEHRIADFHRIRDTYLPIGTESAKVIALLGEPLARSRTGDGIQYWLYVRCNADEEQYYAWTCIIGADGKITKWKKKGIM